MTTGSGNAFRVAGYIRVSQVGGREGESFHSPDVQREKIEAWATYRGARVTRWYIDLDVSGNGKVRRPEFEQLLADARAGHFDAVAVYRLTRFARSTRAAAIALDELEQHNVGLVSVTEDIDTTTAGGKLMRNVLFSIAEFESERTGEEWRAIHARRRQRGLPNVTREITGYRQAVDETTGKKRASLDEIEPTEAAAVLAMYEMRAAGRTYGEIREALHAAGHRTRRGGSYFGQAVIGQILRNPLFAGLVALPDGTLIQGQHEAIVPRDLWERVQQAHSGAVRTNRFHGALLSGLLVCSSCGYRMQFNRGGKPRSNGMVRADHYRCASRQRNERCPKQLTVDADLADRYIEYLFLSRFDPKRMPNGGRVKMSRQQDAWKRQLAGLRAKLNELDASLDKLADDRFRGGTLAAREYERQAARFLEEREEIERQAGDLEATLATVTPLDRNLLDAWDDAPVLVKRRGLRIAIAEIRVLPSPRRGKGQEALLPKRLDVVWAQ